MTVKYVKLIQENIKKFYLTVITDACVKITVVELCFEEKTKESVVETFKKCFGNLKIFQKTFLGKSTKNFCHV